MPFTASDDEMKALAAITFEYTMVVLHRGPTFGTDSAQPGTWEHGRLYTGLRKARVLLVAAPVSDGSDFCGIGIFNASLDQVKGLLDNDLGITSGVYTYRAHRCFSMVGDSISAATSEPQESIAG